MPKHDNNGEDDRKNEALRNRLAMFCVISCILLATAMVGTTIFLCTAQHQCSEFDDLVRPVYAPLATMITGVVAYVFGVKAGRKD